MKGINLRKQTSTGAANPFTYTSTLAGKKRLVEVYVHSSGAVSGAASLTIDSGTDSAYDTVIDTGSVSWTDYKYVPTEEVVLMDDDQVKFSAANSTTATIGLTIIFELL